MYYRVTTYGFDSDRFDEFMEIADGFRDELKTVDGLEMVHSCIVEEGQGMIISRFVNEAAATVALPQIQEILSRAAQFFTTTPQVTTGEVVWEL